MDVRETIENRLEIREYSDEPVDDGPKRTILDAGRLAPSGKNFQHWRFVLVDEGDALRELADRSDTGDWIDGAAFAVVVTTDPQYPWHEIDAGRAVTYMQFAAWTEGVGSCIFTGYDGDDVRELFDIPSDRAVPLVAGFGRPARSVAGRKSREPLEAVACDGAYGEPFER